MVLFVKRYFFPVSTTSVRAIDTFDVTKANDPERRPGGKRTRIFKQSSILSVNDTSE